MKNYCTATDISLFMQMSNTWVRTRIRTGELKGEKQLINNNHIWVVKRNDLSLYLQLNNKEYPNALQKMNEFFEEVNENENVVIPSVSLPSQELEDIKDELEKTKNLSASKEKYYQDEIELLKIKVRKSEEIALEIKDEIREVNHKLHCKNDDLTQEIESLHNKNINLKTKNNQLKECNELLLKDNEVFKRYITIQPHSEPELAPVSELESQSELIIEPILEPKKRWFKLW